jgi:hypothetical protein
VAPKTVNTVLSTKAGKSLPRFIYSELSLFEARTRQQLNKSPKFGGDMTEMGSAGMKDSHRIERIQAVVPTNNRIAE